MEYSPMMVLMLWALTPSEATSEGGISARVQELPQPLMSVQSFTFNNGKPFLAERDPLTGALDLRTTPVAKGADYLYEEFDESGETIDRKDGVSSQNIITPFTNSKESELHKFLNLPVHYSSSGKYPLVSSSYANTKIQGHASNHRLSTTSTAQTPSTVPPSYYTHKTTLQTTPRPSTSSTTVSTTTSKTTTTTTPPPLYEYEYDYDYSDSKSKGDYEFLGVSSEVGNGTNKNGSEIDVPTPFTDKPSKVETSTTNEEDYKEPYESNDSIFENILSFVKSPEVTPNRGAIKYHTSSTTNAPFRPTPVQTTADNRLTTRITTLLQTVKTTSTTTTPSTTVRTNYPKEGISTLKPSVEDYNRENVKPTTDSPRVTLSTEKISIVRPTDSSQPEQPSDKQKVNDTNAHTYYTGYRPDLQPPYPTYESTTTHKPTKAPATEKIPSKHDVAESGIENQSPTKPQGDDLKSSETLSHPKPVGVDDFVKPTGNQNPLKPPFQISFKPPGLPNPVKPPFEIPFKPPGIPNPIKPPFENPLKPPNIPNPIKPPFENPLKPPNIPNPIKPPFDGSLKPPGIPNPVRPFENQPGVTHEKPSDNDNPLSVPQLFHLRPPVRPPLRPHPEPSNVRPQQYPNGYQHNVPSNVHHSEQQEHLNKRPPSGPHHYLQRPPQDVKPHRLNQESANSRPHPNIYPPIPNQQYNGPSNVPQQGAQETQYQLHPRPQDGKPANNKLYLNAHHPVRPNQGVTFPQKPLPYPHLPPWQSEPDRPYPNPTRNQENDGNGWPARPALHNIKPTKPPYSFFASKPQEKDHNKKVAESTAQAVGSVEAVSVGDQSQPTKAQSHFIKISPGQENPSYSLQTSFSIGVLPSSDGNVGQVQFPQEEHVKKLPRPQWDHQQKHPKPPSNLPNILPQFRPNAKIGHAEPHVHFVREPLDTLQPPPLPKPEFLRAEEPSVHRRNGQSNHVTTLQMMPNPPRGVLRAEDKEEPVFVVYPSNGGEGVVVGTRGPQRPLPPDNLNLNDQLDSFPLESEGFKSRIDTPILKSKPNKPPVKNDFPYPLVKPLPVEEESVSTKSPPAKEYSAFSPTVSTVEKDIAEINVIPYLQDYMPFATKKPLPKEPQWPVGSENKPISVTLNTKTTVVTASPATNHKPQDSRPTPLDFQAPFQASLTAPNRGWSVVQKGTENEISTAQQTTTPAQETTEEQPFDAQNFKPQLFGGFKPILPPGPVEKVE
ncbi:proteoglycan 4-like [Cimex lectularius]|uniref:CPR type cuticle protein n=1 Tax=Cimex lectularius TaxID=79782 RepID=A0A8I6SU93_CIMLE|nr:proteoglycan 4-like [Cimex lectularius]